MIEILKKIVLLFILISSSILGTEVPNEIITENPEREVTTIESKKIRDKTTMSLEITKIEPKIIKGRLDNGVLKVKLPTNNTYTNLENLRLRVETLPKQMIKSSRPSKRDMENYTVSDIKNEIFVNRRRKKDFELIKSKDGYSLNIDGINVNENTYISLLVGDKVVRSYLVETTGEIISLGKSTLRYDSRLIADGNKWITRSADIYEDFETGSNQMKSYSNMIDQGFELYEGIMATSVELEGFEKEENTRITTVGNVKYELYKKGESLAAVPIITRKFNTDDLAIYLYVHTDNESQLKYYFMEENNPDIYEYIVIKEAVEFKKTMVKAVLDLRDKDLNISNSGTWDVTQVTSENFSSEEGNLILNVENPGTKFFELESLRKNNVMTHFGVVHNGEKKTAKKSNSVIVDLNKDGEDDVGIFLGDTFKIETLAGMKKVSGENDLRIIAYVEEDYGGTPLELATLDLKIITPEIYSIGEIYFDIDKRFAESIKSGNWISGAGIKEKLDGENIVGYNDVLINKRGNFDYSGVEQLEVMDVLSIEGRENVSNGVGEYKHFLKNIGTDEDEAAAPRSYGGKVVKVSDYDEKMIISKNNSNFNEMLDNKFTILGKDTNNNVSTIYGNAKENYIGNGVIFGSGVINLTKIEGRYVFPNNTNKDSIDGVDGSNKVTLYFTSRGKNNALDASGVVGSKKGKNIANLMQIEDQSGKNITVFGSKLEYSFDEGNLKVGINTDEGDSNTSGGLILEKTGNITPRKIKISYYYAPDSVNNINDSRVIKLGEFVLDIKNDVEFELDGNSVLDFGTMIYDPKNLYHGASEIIKVKNLENRNVKFSVDDTAKMYLKTENSNLTNNEINIVGVKITDLGKITENNENKNIFILEGMAEINGTTVPGIYGGEITITITLEK